MPVTYPEGGIPSLTLRQRKTRQEMLPIDTFRVQLVPLRPAPKYSVHVPEDVLKVIKEMGDYDREAAKIIHLDTKNHVMGVETISVGSLNMSIVHPRETVKGAILNNSASVIFVHNHPSDICTPSDEDMGVTKTLISAFNTVGIALVDSVVVGKTCYFSFKEHGLMPTYIPEAESKEMREIREDRADSRLCVSSATPEKVDFISAMTDYITAPDLERRGRAAEKLRASRYYTPWADTFFYEHDPENAKKNLLVFFNANEQGLGFVNYTYFGVISEYLRAISAPVTESRVRESAGGITIPSAGFTGQMVVSEQTTPDLTAQQIIDLHDRVIEQTGGTKGVLSIGTIDHLIYRLSREKDIFRKVSIALEQIITNHPFFDGNKRTGFQVAELILGEHGYYIVASKEEIIHALLKIAKYQCSIKTIEQWIKRKAEKSHLG